MTPAGPKLELCFGTLLDQPLTELIDIAGTTGYDAVTVSPTLYAAARAEGHSDNDLRHRLADAGVRATVVDPLVADLPGTLAADTAPPWLRPMLTMTEHDFYRVADALGCRVINVAAIFREAVELGRMIDALAALAGRAQRNDLQISIEFMPSSATIPTLDVALDVLMTIASPAAGLTVDTWHFYRGGGTIGELDAVPPGLVTMLQVSDAPAAAYGQGPGNGVDRLLPGEGAIPLRPMLAALCAKSPEVNVGVEIFSRRLRTLPAATAAAQVATATLAVLQ